MFLSAFVYFFLQYYSITVLYSTSTLHLSLPNSRLRGLQ